MELVYQAGGTPVAGFDLWLKYKTNQIEVTTNCAEHVICEVVGDTVRVMLNPLFEVPILELETNQYIGTIDFIHLGRWSAAFTISQENYFDSNLHLSI